MYGFEINEYLNSLSEDVMTINVSFRGIKYLPNLNRFKNLQTLYCSHNQLISLPELPKTLITLNCSYNKLISLPELPKTLITFDCSYNQLISLPALPKTLIELFCSHNKLISLSDFPENLQTINCCYNNLSSLSAFPENLQAITCGYNKLYYFPVLPENLAILYFYNNPIYEIVDSGLLEINQKLKILNKFRDLFYCLKFKQRFRKFLWEKVREKNIMTKYHPNYLIENLHEESDLDIVLSNW